VAGAFLLMRRQALKDVEPFWSLPTRRVVQAAVPPLLVGLVASSPVLVFDWRDALLAWWLIPLWLSLYGCALCAAGSFMPRGIKLFGWFFVLAGCGAFVIGASVSRIISSLAQAHVIMGVAFGLIHLLYGGYLYVTERQRKNAT